MYRNSVASSLYIAWYWLIMLIQAYKMSLTYLYKYMLVETSVSRFHHGHSHNRISSHDWVQKIFFLENMSAWLVFGPFGIKYLLGEMVSMENLMTAEFFESFSKSVDGPISLCTFINNDTDRVQSVNKNRETIEHYSNLKYFTMIYTAHSKSTEQ